MGLRFSLAYVNKVLESKKPELMLPEDAYGHCQCRLLTVETMMKLVPGLTRQQGTRILRGSEEFANGPDDPVDLSAVVRSVDMRVQRLQQSLDNI